MSAGTLTLTNNSAAVGGSGTSFTTELAASDFIVATVGGITYTLPVKSVESATSLTLISNYPGPTQSGVAWSAVPRATQNQITAALVAQTTEALRGLNSDKQNWQAVFSDIGDITVILPDGSTFTGPSWKKISDLLADIDPAGLQQIADQVSADAQQVATDRQDVDAKASQVSGDAATASQAATNAAAANTTAQQAKNDAVAANTAAQQAKTDAQAAAASVNPNNLLQKANNLSELVSTASTARANLGLGTAAVATLTTSINDTVTGRALKVGDWGIGTMVAPTYTNADSARYGGIVEGGGADGVSGNWYNSYGPAIVMNRNDAQFAQIQVGVSNNYLAWRRGQGGVGWQAWRYARDSVNTTVDSSGFVKTASPIVKIFSDGTFETNEESAGCIVSRTGVGEYLISGCTGTNSDGAWGGVDGGFDIPMDKNRQARMWLDYEVNADGSILVKTYHRTYPDSPEFAQNRIGEIDADGVFVETVKNGDPLDIPADTFVLVRVHMPADSKWNQLQDAASQLREVQENEGKA